MVIEEKELKQTKKSTKTSFDSKNSYTLLSCKECESILFRCERV